MKLKNVFLVALTGSLALLATGAHAHALGGDGGLAGGLAHPFMGLDHLLAMVAAGLWAAQLGRRAIWQVPLAFVAVMVAGFGLARLGLVLPVAEPMVIASVAVLGAVVAGAVRVPAAVGAGMVSAFAVFHGYAHGVEMPAAGSAWAYAAGLALTTAGLQLLGLGLGLGLGATPGQRKVLSRLGGTAIAATGVALMGGL
jgi:urease accessory protein